MNEILTQIFSEAKASGQVNLLQVLMSYERVIQERKILYYSEEGVEVYKSLLRWGREGLPGLEREEEEEKRLERLEKLEKPFARDLRIESLTGFADRGLATEGKGKAKEKEKFIERSRPQEPMKAKTRTKTYDVIAEVFRDKQILIRTFHRWVLANGLALRERLLAMRAEKKQLGLRKAEKFSFEMRMKKVLQAWTRFNLSELKKKIAAHCDSSRVLKKVFRVWAAFHRKSEILDGLKFTASFIHSQWLMKKVLICLTRHVHDQMVNKLKTSRVQELVQSNLINLSLISWKKFVNLSLKGKILKLKSDKCQADFLKRRGLLQLRQGCLSSKQTIENEFKPKSFCAKWTSQRVLSCWLKFIISKNTKVFKLQQGKVFRHRHLLASAFRRLSSSLEYLKAKRVKAVKAIVRIKKIKIFRAWKRECDDSSSNDFPDKIYYLWYLLLNSDNAYNFGGFFKATKPKRRSSAVENVETHVKRSLFAAWKESLKSLKSFQLRLKAKMMGKVVGSWRARAKAKVAARNKLEPRAKLKANDVKREVFKSWAEKYGKIRRNKTLFKQFCIQNNKRTVSTKLKYWRFRLKQKIRHNRENQICLRHLRKNLLGKYLASWNYLFRKTKKKSELSRLNQIFFLDKNMLKPWNLWRKNFLNGCKRDNKYMTARMIEAQPGESCNPDHPIAISKKSVKSQSQLLAYNESVLIEPQFSKHVDSKSIQTELVTSSANLSKTSSLATIESRSIFIKPKFSKIIQTRDRKDTQETSSQFEELRPKHESIKIMRNIDSIQVKNTQTPLREKGNVGIREGDRIGSGLYIENPENDKLDTLDQGEDVEAEPDSDRAVKDELNCDEFNSLSLNNGNKNFEPEITFNEKISIYEENQSNLSPDSKPLIFESKNLEDLSPNKCTGLLPVMTGSPFTSSPNDRSELSETKQIIINDAKNEQLRESDSFDSNSEINTKRKQTIAAALERFQVFIKKKHFNTLINLHIYYKELQALADSNYQHLLKQKTIKTLKNFKLHISHLSALSTKHYQTHLLHTSLSSLQKQKQFSKSLKAKLPLAASKLENLSKYLFFSFTFSTILEINISESKLQNKAKNHKKHKTLQKTLKALRALTNTSKTLQSKSDLIHKKHKKLEKKSFFSKWLNLLKIRNFSRSSLVKYHYLLVKDLFSKWQIELKIKEIQQRKHYQLKVFSLAGLQIYAEKTFHAKAHVYKAQTLEFLKLKRKFLAVWKDFKSRKAKSRFYRERSSIRLMKLSINGFKDFHIQSLIEKEVQNRCRKNIAVRYLACWRVKLKKKLKLKKSLKKILICRFVKVESFYLLKWQQAELLSQGNQTVVIKTIRKRRVNKEEGVMRSIRFRKNFLLGKVFYAWDQFVSEHSIKRKRNFIHAIFMGWKIQTRENALLRKYLIESNISEKYLQSSIEIASGVFKSISSLGSFSIN